MTQATCPNSSNPNSGVDGLYPAGSAPEDRVPRLSALCSFGQTPRMVTGILRQLLMQHFADPRQISNPTLRSMLERGGAWRPGVNDGLYIESVARWRPEVTEKRPAILLKEGDWQWIRVGIGDYAGSSWRDGREQFAGLWRGSHTVFAVGNEGAETQILATETAKVIAWYGPLITDQMNMHRWGITKIGALSALQESTENYVVPVDVAYVAEESWTLQVDAPRLKRIVFNTDALLADL